MIPVTRIFYFVIIAGITVVAAQPRCPRVCTYIYQPVCGSNGVTYSNECLLENLVKCRNQDITKVKVGACEDDVAVTKEDKEILKKLLLRRSLSKGHLKVAEVKKDICSLLPETGFCRANFRHWHYDAAVDSCKQFTYGGCHGNDNNFETEEKCLKRCQKCPKLCGENLYKPICGSDGNTYENNCIFEDAVNCQNLQITKVHEGACVQDICSLPPETGFCRAHFRHWHYDAAVDRCKQFTYGGCHGNDNNFETEEKCLKRCQKCPKMCGENLYKPVCGSDGETYENNCVFEDAVNCQNLTITKVHEGACVQDICSLPPDTGFCRAHFRHWHYDAAAGTCKEFVYGGCHGNDNNFETKEICLKKCRKSS